MKKQQQIHIFILIGVIALALGIGVGFVIKKHITQEQTNEDIITRDLNEQ